MLEKLKSTLTGNKDKDQDKHAHPQPQRQLLETVSLISGEEIKTAKKWLDKIKEDCEFFGEITGKHRSELKAFIEKQEEERKNSEGEKSGQTKEDEDEQLTLAEDILDIKDELKRFMEYIGKVEAIENDIRLRVEKYNAPAVTVANPETEQKLVRCEEELRKVRESERLMREMHEAMKQQCVLYAEETRKLEDRAVRLEKELADKNSSIVNLNEEKQALLDMKNSTHPEVEGLKQKMGEFEKRFEIEKSRMQQKDKELEGLRKKLEDERANILTMADELKDKEMKSKRAIEKYEKSKVEVRKFREEKTELIKNLNLEIQSMKDVELRHLGEIEQLNQQLKNKDGQLEELRNRYDNSVSSNLKTLNLQEENRLLSESLRQRQSQLAERTEETQKLTDQISMLKQKRELLLATLEKPVKHEVKTLEKIHKAMEQLYKDYIIDVFDRGDTVQFQKKISTIMTNILELKEDLLM